MKTENLKKIVQIPTGVTTIISDKLQGTIEVEFRVEDPFNEPIKKSTTEK